VVPGQEGKWYKTEEVLEWDRPLGGEEAGRHWVDCELAWEAVG